MTLFKNLPAPFKGKKGWARTEEVDPHIYRKDIFCQKISIVTPSLNQGEYIEQTIQSVLDQQYPNLEYIIIDGGSRDGTVDIIKKYEKYLSYWTSEPDKGQSNAINKGLLQATGDIINWLNADDYYEKNSLFKVAEHFQDPSINCYCGRSNIVDELGSVIRKSSGTDVYKQNLPKTIGWARIDQPETFFRREVFENLGGVNEELHYVMDKEFWMRYLLKYGLKGVSRNNDVLVNFRLHEQSKTGGGSLKFQQETAALFLSLAKAAGLPAGAEFIKYIQNLQPIQLSQIDWFIVDQKLIGKVLQYYYLHLADYCYFTGRRKDCALLLQTIQGMELETVDALLFRKLTFRNKLIPRFIRKLKNELL